MAKPGNMAFLPSQRQDQLLFALESRLFILRSKAFILRIKATENGTENG